MAEVYSVVALKQIVPVGISVGVSIGVIQSSAYCFSRGIAINLFTQYITRGIIRVNVSTVGIGIILTRELTEVIILVAINKATVLIDISDKFLAYLSPSTSEIEKSQRWCNIMV